VAILSSRPRDAPGFLRAHEQGLTPRVPASPPEVTVRPTAVAALRDVALTVGAAAAAVVAAVLLGASDGRLPWAVVAVVLGVGATGVAAVCGAVRRWRRSQLAELQRGYTTATFRLGRFWFASAPDGPVTNGWVQWDWAATWVLRPDGQVRSAPTGAGDAPGLYPSPRHDGAMELWTGHQWSGYLPASPVT
jgi:hypothetical protein